MITARPSLAAMTAPHEAGVILWPTARGGGKLLTAAEHAALARAFEERQSLWMNPGILLASIAVALTAVLASDILGLSDRLGSSLLAAIGIGALIIWQQRRASALFRDYRARPDIAQPRSYAARRRVAADLLSWPLLLLLMSAGGLAAGAGALQFFSGVNNWLAIGCGAVLAAIGIEATAYKVRKD